MTRINMLQVCALACMLMLSLSSFIFGQNNTTDPTNATAVEAANQTDESNEGASETTTDNSSENVSESEINETLSEDKETNPAQTLTDAEDKKVFTGLGLKFSLNPIGRKIDNPYTNDKFSIDFSFGMMADILFLKINPKFWLGAGAEFLMQLGLNSSLPLIDEGSEYGTVAYKFSLIPMGGVVMGFFLNEKLKLRGGVLAGYDRTFIDVQYDDPALPSGTQSGGGFVINAEAGIDFVVTLSPKFALTFGGDVAYLFGITSILMQNTPTISLRVGGLF